jgi:hypothetical protein
MPVSFVDKFIDSLELKGELKGFAKVLLRTQDDCIEFYIKHFGNNHYIINDLLDYRKSKIDMSNLSFDKFAEMCNNIGMKEAFENVFLYHFSTQAIKLVEFMILTDKTSLEEIYSSFVRNPDENVMKNVL